MFYSTLKQKNQHLSSIPFEKFDRSNNNSKRNIDQVNILTPPPPKPFGGRGGEDVKLIRKINLLFKYDWKYKQQLQRKNCDKLLA